jgi:hypothetical protein
MEHSPAAHPRQAGGYLRWIGAAGIVTIAVMRCVIAFLPQLIFDVDPASERELVIASLSMGGSLLLDVLLIVACLFALLGEWRGKHGLDPLLMLLALLPLPIVCWHGCDDAGDLWRGSTWLAAALACATIVHLARDRALRIVITAALVGVIVPLLVRGTAQVSYEHDATVAEYQQHKAAHLQARGWEEDSPATRMFERRLGHREPTGWFTSTNIFGSVAGACVVILVGLIAVALRTHMQSGWWFLMLLMALACAVALWITSSMGAMLATIGGLILLFVAWLCLRGKDAGSGCAKSGQARGYVGSVGALLVLMIFGAMAGVIARGVILPEGFAGEKSLLFRWHYLQAAIGIVSEHPWTGVGPDNFQEAYTQHRVPRNPEEVQSAHAMFTDWIAMLGILGGAWVALIITLAVRTGEAIARFDNAGVEPAPPLRISLNFALVVAALGLTPAMLIEWPALAPIDLFVRVLGLIGYVIIVPMIAIVLARCDDRWLRGVSAAAVAVLLVHGQIEMTFFQGGSVVWTMAMVGLLGDARPASTRGIRAVTAIGALIIPAVWALWLTWSGAIPALAQEREVLAAARLLDPVRNNPGNAEVILIQRPLASQRLVQAYERWPINVLPLNAAALQLLLATPPPEPPAATAPGATRPAGAAPPLGLLMRAEEIIDRAVVAHGKPSSTALARSVHAALAAATDDPQQWAITIAISRRLAEGDPYGVMPWRWLGDVLWTAGEKQEAAKAYRTTLRNSDNFDLDEMKQLSPRMRSAIEHRIVEAAQSPASP